MPKPRKPTAQLALSGQLDARPKQYANRNSEPSSGKLGTAPKFYDKAKRALWKEVVGTVPPGVLQHSDRFIVEVVCSLLTDLRNGTGTVAGIAQLRQSLASLGMTPADRSRVSAAPPEKTDDPLSFLDSDIHPTSDLVRKLN